MTYQEMLDQARKVLEPKCKVCPECNGIACKGQIPGVGAIGSGEGFIECRNYLKQIKLNMDPVHEDYPIDPSIEIFGKKFSYPFFIAPIGGMSINYTNYLTEKEYMDITVMGALDCGRCNKMCTGRRIWYRSIKSRRTNYGRFSGPVQNDRRNQGGRWGFA